MNENDVANVTENKSAFTVKRVLQVLSVLGIIFVFCPSFLVSCSGQNINVSVMTAVGGLSAYGEKVVDPHPIMLVCLLIPIAVLVLLFLKKFTDKKTAGIILICTIVDLVIWLIFRATVKKFAEENYCSFKTTGWYTINMIVMILVILLTVLVIVCKMQLDADLITAFTGGGTQNALNQMSATMSQMSNAVTQIAGNVAGNVSNKVQKENVIGFCSKCGSPIAYDSKFCISCGTPVPESMIAEAEAARKAAEEAARKEAEEKARAAEEAAGKESGRPMFCQQCGAKLQSDAMFCESCGTKIK